MSFRQLWEGANNDSFFSKMDGRTKLCILFFFALLMVIVDNPRTLFVLFSISIGLHAVSGIPLYRWRVLAVFILLGLWGSVVSQALFFAQNPRTPIFTLISPAYPVLGTLTGGLYVYQEGIIYGAVQGMRSVSMISMGLLVCWTSDPRQLLKGLSSWHMPPQISFMLVTAIRFFPVLAAEAGEVIIALQLRGHGDRGRLYIIRHLPYIVKPLLARCIRRSQTLALSVVSRGLFLAKRQNHERWDLREKSVCIFLMGVITVAGISKILYALSRQGLYFGGLRMIYDWTKLYL